MSKLDNKIKNEYLRGLRGNIPRVFIEVEEEKRKKEKENREKKEGPRRVIERMILEGFPDEFIIKKGVEEFKYPESAVKEWMKKTKLDIDNWKKEVKEKYMRKCPIGRYCKIYRN